MSRLFKFGACFLSIAAPGEDRPKFQAGPAASYAARQTIAGVTIAAKVVESDEEARAAFGKKNPYRHGILPVLVVIDNASGQTLRLHNLKAEYLRPDRSRVEATPAAEVRYASGARKPNVDIGPAGPRVSRRKNPLDSWEIEGRALAAKLIPAGESASGFVYFQTGFQVNSVLYITGIEEAGTGKELFYFEIPLRDAR